MADTRKKRDEGPLHSGNKLKLMVFGSSASYGATMTGVEGTLKAEWAETREVARMAEQAGFEAIIPYVRFRGLGGTLNPSGRSFETITWSAGLAEATERIQVFATALVPTINPLLIAKQLTTVDHISDGRAALNVVAGWFGPEIAMFGIKQREHEERYAYADEWMTIIRELWNTGRSNFSGKYFTLEEAEADPLPIQDPHPIVMGAGNSPAGRAFAAKHADINFVVAQTIDDVPALVETVKDEARQNFGREIQVFGMGRIVCRDTEAEAVAYNHHMIHEKGDWEAASNMASQLGVESGSLPPEAWDGMGAAIIGGFSALPLIGTPEQIVDGMQAMVDAGLDGITLNWPDYRAGIRQYDQVLRPLLVQAGIRTN